MLADSRRGSCSARTRCRWRRSRRCVASLPKLEHVIVIEGDAAGDNARAHCAGRAAEVEPNGVEERVQAVAPEDLATLVYTSGTTGPPKGCMLTHANFLAATAMYRGQLKLDDVQPTIYMFLPLAHVLARLAQTVVLDVGGHARVLVGRSEEDPRGGAGGRPDALRGGAAYLREGAHGRGERGGERRVRTRAWRSRGRWRWDAGRAAPSARADRWGRSEGHGWDLADRPRARRRCGSCLADACRWRWWARRRSTTSCWSSSTRAA